ncbi:hypothetical protein IAT40_006495 [Kwoniella sp. CBS 6097]
MDLRSMLDDQSVLPRPSTFRATNHSRASQDLEMTQDGPPNTQDPTTEQPATAAPVQSALDTDHDPSEQAMTHIPTESSELPDTIQSVLTKLRTDIESLIEDHETSMRGLNRRPNNVQIGVFNRLKEMAGAARANFRELSMEHVSSANPTWSPRRQISEANSLATLATQAGDHELSRFVESGTPFVRRFHNWCDSQIRSLNYTANEAVRTGSELLFHLLSDLGDRPALHAEYDKTHKAYVSAQNQLNGIVDIAGSQGWNKHSFHSIALQTLHLIREITRMDDQIGEANSLRERLQRRDEGHAHTITTQTEGDSIVRPGESLICTVDATMAEFRNLAETCKGLDKQDQKEPSGKLLVNTLDGF